MAPHQARRFFFPPSQCRIVSAPPSKRSPLVSRSEDAQQADDALFVQLESWRTWLRALEQDRAADSPLESVYKSWRAQIEPAHRLSVSPSYSRAVAAGVEFMMLGEQLLRAISSLPSGAAVAMPAADPLRTAFAGAGNGRSAEQDLWADMLAAIPEELRIALDHMSATLGQQSINGMPMAAGALLAKELLQVLGNDSGPGARSWDFDVRQLLRGWSNFQSAKARYETLLVGSADRALSRLSERIAGLGTDGRPLDSVRAAYDLWVDCSEESYAALLASDDFADAHASAINALVSLKATCSSLGDRFGVWLNAPSRRDQAALEKRLHEVRREHRYQRRQLDEVRHLWDALDRRLRELEGPSDDSSALATRARRKR